MKDTLTQIQFLVGGKKAAEKGVEFIKNEVTEIALGSKKINAITLKDGSK